ncbi:hypothetical protein [Candidatus Bandiella euplotis]|uniref:Uncharacterized protein n=1 Tax=Candidatus Bandiella euplotis TaxID=1664265 RepID=A0ABZ0UMJ0_9RICK|nr:hypothetical protein [Candidatus Bandiella woodruffii]WPX97152.1 hypothetical protein Bandiella_01296 [Candidatus Bandiella woodruffii]
MRQNQLVQHRSSDDGKYYEIYRAKARKSGANYVRAAGHGVLDVMTLGLWEVAGTPVEGALSNNRGFIVAQIMYSHKDSDVFENFTIYDANGQKVQ